MKMHNLVLYKLPWVAEMILLTGDYLVSILIFLWTEILYKMREVGEHSPVKEEQMLW